MQIETLLAEKVKKGCQEVFGFEPGDKQVQIQKTRKEFEGDLTVVVFPFVKQAKMSPEDAGKKLGEYFVSNVDEVSKFNVVKGFLNLLITDAYWLGTLDGMLDADKFGYSPKDSGDTVMVEYSSPNTNKPLHLGHLRNNFLGYSVSKILEAAGHKVIKTQIINDRGIHICKSMLAWKLNGNGETPESSGMKGDKLVGKYYVEFDKMYRAEVQNLVSEGMEEELAKKEAPLMKQAQEMLLKWEAGDAETVDLWKTMNGWVYEGFDQTYKAMGVDFDTLYYESDTYLVGKDAVKDGLDKGVFFTKDDGSVWIDLTDDGLDEKLLLRKDGTAVYMTQDIGTAMLRVKDFPGLKGIIYTVGNEQDYHFKVLFTILDKLGFDWAEGCHHLSYGMVDLPTGRMKSREGTVVDADDLIEEMRSQAQTSTEELGKLEGADDREKQELYRIIGLGALKYYLLRVDPKKRMMFNPEESIDMQGNTGPFIQYTYARIQSILRKVENDNQSIPTGIEMEEAEREIVKALYDFPAVVNEASNLYDPSVVANYTYDLVKGFNHFYQTVPILGAKDDDQRSFRILLSEMTGRVIETATDLLGIEVPERM